MKFLVLPVFLLPLFCVGQKQGNIWYFGGKTTNFSQPGAGLDFNSGSAVPLTNSGMNYTEGSAAYCNSAGQLLFYTKGDTVYDRTHGLMLNGDSLGGHWSSEQSALIVPITGDTNLYYIFSNDGLPTSNGTGLHYSLVDMTLNNGLGAVLNPKAISLVSNTSEQLTGCKHANGSDFWIITTHYYSSTLYAYQVSDSGVALPVITNLGFNCPTIGTIEMSPNADKIAIKISFPIFSRHLIDFDNATGIFSNPYAIGVTNGVNRGCGFSPDGNLFYDIHPLNPDSLFQYDLNAQNISASKTFIAVLTSPSYRFDMQAGPDGKLYISAPTFQDSLLEVIHYPNLPGAACNYQYNGVSLSGRNAGVLLPNELLIANQGGLTGIYSCCNLNHISVFPNPVTERLHVSSNSSQANELVIYDMFSRRVLHNMFTGSAVMDVEYLPAGIYIFEVKNYSGQIKKGKLVKR